MSDGFSVLTWVIKGIRGHAEELGPLQRALLLLAGAALFLLFLGVLVGLPIVWFDDFVYVAITQVCLIGAFVMLLLTIEMDVYDRFVFSMTLFLILATAPILVTLGLFFEVLEPVDAAGVAAARADAKPEMFMYALQRGVAHIAWSLPMLFVFFTFYPRLKNQGPAAIRSRLRLTVIAALVMHTIASVLHVLMGGSSKAFKSTDGAGAILASEIHFDQVGFIVFQAIYILLGYTTILAAYRWYKRNDNRWLSIVVLGMVSVQGAYIAASYFNRHLIQHYPASRTTAKYVSVLKHRESEAVVFVIPRPRETISSVRFDDFRTYAVCEDRARESLKFTFIVDDPDDFETAYNESRIEFVDQEDLFCQPLTDP